MKNLLYVGNRLSKHGHTATAIEVLGKLLEAEGFSVAYASSIKNKPLRLADMLWKTLRLSRKTDYVLIDTYSTSNFWYAFAVSQLCRFLRLKYIPILHGGNLPRRLSNNPRLCPMIFKNAHVNVAPSGYLQQAFSDAGFSVIKIPNPFDAADFPYKHRQFVGPKLLWVRSFAAIYNPEMALRVMALLQEKYPDASLCMVGPGTGGMMEAMKRTAVSENLNVTFTGRLSKKDWAALADGYDVFINTANTDNAPFSIIEALSLGLAVVSTDVGGIPHLLKDRETALLVPRDDARAMFEAVCEVIENDGLRHSMLANSRQIAGESDPSAVAEKWKEILI